ncbi:MAG: hypothetical protein J2P36_25455 [Ktedonobacteraceae bacterium]|nr:hypothetical protein [Ktedonobacteraceae bacterium]
MANYKEKAPTEWNENDLIEWIKNKQPLLLNDDKIEKLRNAEVTGKAFLSSSARDKRFFIDDCGISPGTAVVLVDLSRELAEEDSKLLSFISCTPRRRQANNVIGNRQQAKDVDMLSDISDQPKPIADERICQRTHTVIRLAEIVEEEQVVLVRGTPSSGKTVLSRLLRDYFEKCGDNVVFIRGWRAKGVNAADYLTSRCRNAGYPGIQISEYGDANVIFIIDEAQLTYSDLGLWDFIKERIGRREGPKFCLFSSYGNPSEGMVKTAETERYTPPFLNTKKRVSLTPSRTEGSPDVGLFYDDLEFRDVVRRFCADPATRLKLDKAAQTYLFKMTNGHPGAVGSMLNYIFQVFISCGFQVDDRLTAIGIWT